MLKIKYYQHYLFNLFSSQISLASQRTFDDDVSPRRARANAYTLRSREFDDYLKAKHKQKNKLNQNPLEHWSDPDVVRDFPALSLLAKSVFVILPSSAASERLFFWAQLIITDKRNKLSTKTVQMLAALHHCRSNKENN